MRRSTPLLTFCQLDQEIGRNSRMQLWRYVSALSLRKLDHENRVIYILEIGTKKLTRYYYIINKSYFIFKELKRFKRRIIF